MNEKIERAYAIFNEWNDVTGCFEKNTSYYFEMQSVIEDIVKMASARQSVTDQGVSDKISKFTEKPSKMHDVQGFGDSVVDLLIKHGIKRITPIDTQALIGMNENGDYQFSGFRFDGID